MEGGYEREEGRGDEDEDDTGLRVVAEQHKCHIVSRVYDVGAKVVVWMGTGECGLVARGLWVVGGKRWPTRKETAAALLCRLGTGALTYRKYCRILASLPYIFLYSSWDITQIFKKKGISEVIA